jgi:hypothetical protein
MRVLIAALIVLLGCTDDGANRRTDAAGYVLPQQCRADVATVTASVLVTALPRAELESRWTALGQTLRPGWTLNGMTQSLGRIPFIFIANDLAGWRLAETIWHEKNHAYCTITRDACCTGHFAVGGI